MIRLMDLLEDQDRDYVSKSKKPHSIWITPEKQWAATDEWGVVRYYNTREEAWAFANNKGKESPHPGRPESKQRRQYSPDKETDDRADED